MRWPAEAAVLLAPWPLGVNHAHFFPIPPWRVPPLGTSPPQAHPPMLAPRLPSPTPALLAPPITSVPPALSLGVTSAILEGAGWSARTFHGATAKGRARPPTLKQRPEGSERATGRESPSTKGQSNRRLTETPPCKGASESGPTTAPPLWPTTVWEPPPAWEPPIGCCDPRPLPPCALPPLAVLGQA
jgi:hypothetical protein